MRRLGWLIILASSTLAAGCGPELRPEDSALRSLAPRGSYDKLEPASRGWPSTSKPAASGD